MHYLYHIENKRNGKIYIGKSMEREDSRWQEHVCDARYGRTQMPIHRAIRKYGQENFSYNIIHMYETQEEALLAEIECIARLRDFGVELYNVTAGGEGTSFKRGPRSAEHTAKLKCFKKGHIPWNTGKERPIETRNKVSKNAHVRKISDERREEIKKLYTTNKYSQKELGDMYGVGRDQISRIVNNKTGWVARMKKNQIKSRSYDGGQR